jgi:hypothetical protein
MRDGWSPLKVPRPASDENRTAHSRDLQDLATAVDGLRSMAAAAGRDETALAIQVDAPRQETYVSLTVSVDHVLSFAHELARAAATSMVVRPPRDSLGHCLDAMERFAKEIAPALSTIV